MGEREWNAHYRCTHCHGLKAKADIIMVDDRPICRHGTCKEAYELNTRPKPMPITQSRWEHG